MCHDEPLVASTLRPLPKLTQKVSVNLSAFIIIIIIIIIVVVVVVVLQGLGFLACSGSEFIY
jgi:hypothetical protein